MAGANQQTNASGVAVTTRTTHTSHVVQRRPSLWWALGATVVDIVITGAVLVLLNLAPLRDGLFALQAQAGTHVTSAPLLARGFLSRAVPVLNAAIMFAFAIRLLTRVVGARTWTLTLGLLARLAGGAAMVFLVLQPIIFAIDPAIKAPLGPGKLQTFAEYWGRVVLWVGFGFLAIGVIDQVIAIARQRKRLREGAGSATRSGGRA